MVFGAGPRMRAHEGVDAHEDGEVSGEPRLERGSGQRARQAGEREGPRGGARHRAGGELEQGAEAGRGDGGELLRIEDDRAVFVGVLQGLCQLCHELRSKKRAFERERLNTGVDVGHELAVCQEGLPLEGLPGGRVPAKVRLTPFENPIVRLSLWRDCSAHPQGRRTNMKRLCSSFCVFLLFHVVVGCAGSFQSPPTYPFEDPQFKEANPIPKGLDADFPVPLTLLPGDTVTVRTTSNDNAEYEGLIIDDEGKVHVPIAGPVQISGLAPHQAERTIEGVLQKYDRFVRVSVIVTAWGGHFATVIGAVLNEGPKTLTPSMRIAELLAAAGGPLRVENEGELKYIADLDGARLMRKSQVVPISVRLALSGDPKHNVLVHPGDQLFVPAGLGSRIAVLGITGDGGAMVTYRPGIRVTEALALAGGVTINSDFEDVRIVRGPLKNPKIYQFSLQALVDGHTGDVQLAPGDVVFVSEHWAATMSQVLDRIAPIIAIGIAAMNSWLIFETIQIRKDDQAVRTSGSGN